MPDGEAPPEEKSIAIGFSPEVKAALLAAIEFMHRPYDGPPPHFWHPDTLCWCGEDHYGR